ncbi:MAG: PIN domain-containing protein [Acidobacteria bacterium]|nr:MAG: PIN domain-containing protein [Acidobacteriota bacterium]REK05839.1 MAG: PIN domain-containing protein [Acidobacteriota bacterium]
MIAVDTNILIYARREELPEHGVALDLLKSLAEGRVLWALPWPSVYEFLRVVTHPRVFDPPTDLDAALDDLASLLRSPSLVLLGEGRGHFRELRKAARSARVFGNLVHESHIAALCLEHGVTELLTRDRDFARFAGLATRDPFAGT